MQESGTYKGVKYVCIYYSYNDVTFEGDPPFWDIRTDLGNKEIPSCPNEVAISEAKKFIEQLLNQSE